MKKKNIIIGIVALVGLLAFGGGVLASPAFPAGILYPFGTQDQTAGILEVFSGASAPGAVNVYGPTSGAMYRPDGAFLYSRNSTNWTAILRSANGLQILSSTGNVILPTNLPSVDPHIAGALYVQAGYLKVSAGK